MRMDYLPTFRKTLVQPLVVSEKEGIEEVVEEMQACLPAFFTLIQSCEPKLKK